MEETTNEKTKVNAKPVKRKIYWTIFIFLILIICCVSGLFTITFSLQLTKCKEQFEKEIIKNTVLKSSLNVKATELNELKQRVKDIRDKADLLKRDIELYIKNRFKTVPTIVAANIAQNVVERAEEFSVSPELVVGIIEVESAFNPLAVSSKQARGLMQVLSSWAKKFGLKDEYELHNIDENIKSGIKVFKIHLEEAKGDISQALYLYVGKDKSYAPKVFMSMGRFTSFRSTIDEKEQTIGEMEISNGETEKIKKETKGEKVVDTSPKQTTKPDNQ